MESTGFGGLGGGEGCEEGEGEEKEVCEESHCGDLNRGLVLEGWRGERWGEGVVVR